jgi:hypothetical protein
MDTLTDTPPDNTLPDASWTAERLTAYAQDQMTASKNCDKDAKDASRASAIHSFRAGHALSLIKARLVEAGEYDAWLKKNHIGKTRAWQDLKLYEKTRGDVNAIKGMTRNQAKKRFGIILQSKAEEPNHDAPKGDPLPLEDYRLECCAVAELGPLRNLQPASLDLAIANAPWDKESLPLYDDIGAFARTYLKTGRLLLCYAGALNLLDNAKRLENAGLVYFTTFGIIFPDMAKQAKLNGLRLRQGWRPILVFTNGKHEPRYWVDDSLDGLGRSKGEDLMETNPAEELYWIHSLTLPGDLVAGLHCGVMPEAVACRQLGRRFIGCDPTAWKVDVGKERVAAVSGIYDGYIYTRSRG